MNPRWASVFNILFSYKFSYFSFFFILLFLFCRLGKRIGFGWIFFATIAYRILLDLVIQLDSLYWFKNMLVMFLSIVYVNWPCFSFHFSVSSCYAMFTSTNICNKQEECEDYKFTVFRINTHSHTQSVDLRWKKIAVFSLFVSQQFSLNLYIFLIMFILKWICTSSLEPLQKASILCIAIF